MTQLTSTFDRALSFARITHATQQRKGSGTPYLAHLLAVCSLVLEDGGDETEAIAALLHDAIEDRGGEGMRAQIAAEFGSAVAQIVQACSDTPAGWEGGEKPGWRERKEHYLAHLETDRTPGALRVSLADKLHNARSIVFDAQEHGASVWERFDPQSDQPWYYERLADVFRRRSAGPMVAELERAAQQMRVLAADRDAR